MQETESIDEYILQHIDPEFFLYMMLPNGTQAFGTALFFIMLGYGFLNLSGACQQT